MTQTDNAKLHFFPQAKAPTAVELAPQPGLPRGVLFDLALLAPLLFFICFYGLGNTSIHHVDETTHTRVTQEMLLDGEWWHPKVFGQSYFNKPPFKMWLTAVPVSLLGESNFSYRLVDGICGVLTSLALYFFALSIFRSRVAGVVTVVSLLSCRSYVFVHGIRTSTQDAMLLLLLTLAMITAYTFLEKVRSNIPVSGRWSSTWLAVLGGTLIGLSVLTKNVAGFLPLMMIGVYLALSGDLPTILRKAPKQIALVVLLSFLIPALYLIPRIAYDPHLLKVMFGDEVMDRVTDGYHNRGNFWFYFKRLFRYRAAVPPELIVVGTVFGVFGAFFYDRRKYLFLLVWAIFPVLLFTFVPSRLTWYMAPAFPGMALLAGAAFAAVITALTQAVQNYERRTLPFRSLATVLLMTSFLALFGFGLQRNYEFVADRIISPPKPRLPFDLLTAAILQSAHHGKPVRTLVYGSPQLGRNEKLYLDMHPDIRRLGSLNELTEQVAAANNVPLFVFAEAENFSALVPKIPFTSYAFLPPANHRNRWAIAFATGDLTLPGMQSTKEIFDFDGTSKNFLAGWSSAGMYHDLSIRRTRGPVSSLLLNGDRARYAYGTQMKLNLSALAPSEGRQPSIAILLNGAEVARFENIRGGFKTFDFRIPPGHWVSGQNVITFRTFFAEGDKTPAGPEIGLQEELLMMNWLSIRLAHDLVPLS